MALEIRDRPSEAAFTDRINLRASDGRQTRLVSRKPQGVDFVRICQVQNESDMRSYLRFKKLLGVLRENSALNLISDVRRLCCVKSFNTISIKHQTKKRLIKVSHNFETRFVDLHFVQQAFRLISIVANVLLILTKTVTLSVLWHLYSFLVSTYCCRSIVEHKMHCPVPWKSLSLQRKSMSWIELSKMVLIRESSFLLCVIIFKCHIYRLYTYERALDKKGRQNPSVGRRLHGSYEKAVGISHCGATQRKRY